MVNNSTNINKTNNHLSLNTKKRSTTYDVVNTDPVVGQTNMTSEIQILSWDRQIYWVDKLINETSTLCIFLVVIYIERQEIH